MMPRFTVVQVLVGVEVGGQLRVSEIAGSFDEVRSIEAARAVGKQVGDMLADSLALRLQHGERLAA